MSLLETLDDDIADILGSDNEESSKKVLFTPKPINRHFSAANNRDGQTLRKNVTKKNSKSEKKSLSRDYKLRPKTKRRLNSLLHSQSNRSLPSTMEDISESSKLTMSQDEAISLLQSESNKNLIESKSVSKSLSIVVTKDPKQNDEKIKKDENVENHHHSILDFDFPESPSQPQKTDKNENKRSQSTSDDDSNDSILDWLDEPRVKPSNKRKPLLLPKKKKMMITPKQNTTAAKETKKQSPRKEEVTAPKNPPNKNDEISLDSSEEMDNIKQWQDWLGLNSDNANDADFMHFAEDAAKSGLPSDWEKVNDNLYHNIRTNQRTMTHPLLISTQAKLKTARNDKIQKLKEKMEQISIKPTPKSSHPQNDVIKKKSTPVRQIGAMSDIDTPIKKSSEVVVPSAPITKKYKEMAPAKAQIKNAEQEVQQSQQIADSLVTKNLRMELSETRTTLNRLMNDKRSLMEEIEELNTKTEIMLNEQRIRLMQAHKMETNELKRENQELRALNSKIKSEHQKEMIDLESSLNANDLKQKQHKMNELRLVEQRGRDELAHQMEMHRKTVEEIKKQHLNEIEMLNDMHTKQLANFRKQNQNQSNLNFLITKVETSTNQLNKIQKDIEIERECNNKERESKIEIKERILSEKDDDLLRERKCHRELLEKFKVVAEETKMEKDRIREIESDLKKREEKMSRNMIESNRQINQQRNELNEQRRKFELLRSRWSKQKEDELDDIQRLKTEHTNSIQVFYEEQEIERNRLSKQRAILNEDKAAFIKSKKEFDVELEHLNQQRLEFQGKEHKLQIEKSKFERKVQDVTSLSRRVYQQSENVTKMYNESKLMEEENSMIQSQLMSQSKEFKMIKHQLMLERNQIENERKLLEQEQLSLLTTKRDMLQEIDTIKSFESIEAQKNYQKRMSPQQIVQTAKFNRQSVNINKINSELKELKDFVSECNKNISNYKMDIDSFKHKRISVTAFNSARHHSPYFNPLRMSFPSFSTNTKSTASFLSHSIQNSHSRSLKSLQSTLSSRISTNNPIMTSKMDVSDINNLSKIPTSTENKESNKDVMRTPTMRIAVTNDKRNNPINESSGTDSTLVQSSYLSMGNIDTPITIDNKNKFVKKTEQRSSLNDSTFPMTPTKMPNLSVINIKEEDNQEVDSSDEDEQLRNLQSDIDHQANVINPINEDEEEKREDYTTKQ